MTVKWLPVLGISLLLPFSFGTLVFPGPVLRGDGDFSGVVNDPPAEADAAGKLLFALQHQYQNFTSRPSQNNSPHPNHVDQECKDYHQKNTTEAKCLFISHNNDCKNNDGFINYLLVIYCTFGDLRILGLCIMALWLVYLLIALGATAEDFFCPNLDVMSHTLKMSQNIAGVTLLAFGNGAPDIFSAIAAITNSRNGEAGLAIGALFGAGIFVTTVVAGSIAVMHPFKMVERPFLRDTIFYLAAAFWTFYVLFDGKIRIYEAAGFIILYVLYVIVVLLGRHIYQTRKKKQNAAGQSRAGERNGTSETNAANGYLSDSMSTNAHLSVTERLAVASLVGGVDDDIIRSITPTPHLTDQDNNANESLPLLGGSREPPPPGQLKELFTGLCPLDLKEWSEKTWYSKVWEIIKSPLTFLLTSTIPVVDYSEPKHNWNRLLNTLNLLTAPVFCAFATKSLTHTITGSFQVWHLILPLSFILAAVVFITSKPTVQPVYHWIFSYVGFIVAVLWIYSLANEIVNILQMYGIEFNINDAILGLTVLAWGNSIGDLVADVTMAKQGFPTMGMSACFGGPMFNMLLGIGISCTIASLDNGGTFMLETNTVQYVLALGLAVSLLSSMFIMLFTRFHVTKWYGVYLFILYVIFLVVALLVEEGVIPW